MLLRQNVTRWTIIAVALSAAVSIQGCGMFAGGHANDYTSAQALGENTIRFGTIVSLRNVQLKNEQSGLGMVGGGVVGGLGGSLLGGGKGQVGTSIGGALLGAAAGAAIEKGLGSAKGVEITVRLDNGDLTSITQNAKGELFTVGQRVRLLMRQGVTRVTSNPT